MDRKANRGVAGNDIIITVKHHDRTVDFRGINNHEIVSIPLVTACGVTLTISGEVITNVCQCACHGKKDHPLIPSN